MGFYGTYPLVNVNIVNWKITMFHGKTHVISMAIFNSYVKLPEGLKMMKLGDALCFTHRGVCFVFCQHQIVGLLLSLPQKRFLTTNNMGM